MFWGRFAVTKPLSQIHGGTLSLLQGLSPRPSFGGFGLNQRVPTRWAPPLNWPNLPRPSAATLAIVALYDSGGWSGCCYVRDIAPLVALPEMSVAHALGRLGFKLVKRSHMKFVRMEPAVWRPPARWSPPRPSVLTIEYTRHYSVLMASDADRRESNRLRTARARAKRRSQGLCLDCAAPATIEDGQPRARCPVHLRRAALWQLEARGGVRNPDRLSRAALSP